MSDTEYMLVAIEEHNKNQVDLTTLQEQLTTLQSELASAERVVDESRRVVNAARGGMLDGGSIDDLADVIEDHMKFLSTHKANKVKGV